MFRGRAAGIGEDVVGKGCELEMPILILRAKIEHVRRRERAPGRPALLENERDREEMIGVLVGQRSEQDRVDDREDGGVRTNSEREGEDGDKSEAGRFAQLAQGEAKIIHKVAQASSLRG